MLKNIDKEEVTKFIWLFISYLLCSGILSVIADTNWDNTPSFLYIQLFIVFGVLTMLTGFFSGVKGMTILDQLFSKKKD